MASPDELAPTTGPTGWGGAADPALDATTGAAAPTGPAVVLGPAADRRVEPVVRLPLAAPAPRRGGWLRPVLTFLGAAVLAASAVAALLLLR